MSALAVPEKWIHAIDEKKFADVARFQLFYRIGSAEYAELPVGAAVSCSADGTVCAPTLAPGPLTLREFVGRVYELGVEHFLADEAEGGASPKAADLRILLLDARDKTIATASKKLRRDGRAVVADSDRAVNESNNVLAQTVRSLGSHVVSITSVEARSRNDYESVMCNQMREVSAAWQEVNKDREKIGIDLVEAAEAKVRAEEKSKQLELERQIAEEKGFFDSTIGAQLGSMLVVQLVPKLIGFVDGALTTASVGLEKRKLKATAELAEYRRDLERRVAEPRRGGDRAGDRSPAEADGTKTPDN